MVFSFLKQISANIHRKIRRSFLAEPDKTPQRVAIAMASVLLISIIITYNVLYETEQRKKGVKPPSVMDVFRERSAKQKLEHLELQRNIAQARDNTKATRNDF